jgi:hypothetical protein
MAYTFTARQGDTFKHQIAVKEDDNTTPVSLLGATIEFSIAPVPGGAPALQFTTAPEVVITNETGGVFQLTLTPTQTRALTLNWYVYEITITFSDSRRLTILDGAFTVEREVKA